MELAISLKPAYINPLFKLFFANHSTNGNNNLMNNYHHPMNLDSLLLNDEYNLLNKAVHSLNYYHNPLHDAGVSMNDKGHLLNAFCYSMNVVDYSPNHRDYSSDYQGNNNEVEQALVIIINLN